MVFYRKYRPQIIDDLDEKSVVETLTSVLSAKDIPHAFLFTGPKGLGKTSTARIVAKSVNCLNKKKGSPEPCGVCEQCVSITNGTNMDIQELDAASNRGIDEIRDLREKVRLSPVSAQKKVYIIDEVHMLTTEAFNALLKTIEEPPPHALFIMCTTEPQKVPPTILSRCCHIVFHLAKEDELSRSFMRIAKGEKMQIEEDALRHIASLSDGSFRDGAKVLEELMLLANGAPITKKLVEEKYQVTSINTLVQEILQAIEKKDTKNSLRIIGQTKEQGIESKYFLTSLIELLHKELLLKVGVLQGDAKTKLSIEDIKKLMTLLSRAYGELKYTVLPQMPLELAVIEWGMETVVGNLPHAAESSVQIPRITQKTQSPPKPTSADLSGSNKFDWQQFIAKVKEKNNSLSGVLRGCSMKSYDEKTLVIEALYKFHKERLEESKSLAILEEAVKEITGNTREVKITLKGGH